MKSRKDLLFYFSRLLAAKPLDSLHYAPVQAARINSKTLLLRSSFRNRLLRSATVTFATATCVTAAALGHLPHRAHLRPIQNYCKRKIQLHYAVSVKTAGRSALLWRYIPLAFPRCSDMVVVRDYGGESTEYQAPQYVTVAIFLGP